MFLFSALFCVTSFKSIYDLIVSEIIHKKVPLCKLTFRKLFHVLLPISQIIYCVCTLYYDSYCVGIENQARLHTILTGGSSYLLVICFVLNALHWAFLTYEMVVSIVTISVAIFSTTFYILVPTILLMCIAFISDSKFVRSMHVAETIYHSFTDLVTIFVSVFGWCILKRRVTKMDAPYPMQKLITRLRYQMIFCVFFFFCRGFFLLLLSIINIYNDAEDIHICEKVDDVTTVCQMTRIIYFLSTVLGDIPLAILLLYFLEYRPIRQMTGHSYEDVNNSEYVPILEGVETHNSLVNDDELKPERQYLSYLQEDRKSVV